MAFPSVTYTFANGSTADATQVDQNFTDLINGLSDTTKDISVNNITAANTGTTTLSGNVVLGSSTSFTITFNGKVASSIPVGTNTSYDFGSATLGLRSVYIGGTSTFTTRIMSAATASWTLTLPTTAGASGQMPQTDGSGDITWAYPYSYPPSRNLLVNGGFDYWLAIESAATTIANGVSTYGPDQWYGKNSLGTNGVLTISQQTGSLAGSVYACQLKITTAPTAGQTNGCELYQTFSNLTTVQHLYNQTASFAVQVKAAGNVNQVGVQFFYKTTEAKVDTAIGSEQTFSVSTSGYTLCYIDGQALGTSSTTSGVIGVRIRITGVSAGNTYDLNNGFLCEQATVSVTPVHISFARQYSDPANELIACNFFYRKSYSVGTALATSTQVGMAVMPLWASGTYNVNHVNFTPMRVAPTLSYWDIGGNASKFSAFSNGAFGRSDNQGVVAELTSSTNGFYFRITQSSGAAEMAGIHWAADSRI